MSDPLAVDQALTRYTHRSRLPRLIAGGVATIGALVLWGAVDLIADSGNRELIRARRKEHTWGRTSHH